MRPTNLVTSIVLGFCLAACAPEQGPAGQQGIAGATGARGPAGQDATPVTSVKFCDEAPSYPSTFPEYGLLIGGVVYGVYSANGGFLAALPPGRYESNAVGSKCNFTINANGTVSR